MFSFIRFFFPSFSPSFNPSPRFSFASLFSVLYSLLVPSFKKKKPFLEKCHIHHSVEKKKCETRRGEVFIENQKKKKKQYWKKIATAVIIIHHSFNVKNSFSPSSSIFLVLFRHPYLFNFFPILWGYKWYLQNTKIPYFNFTVQKNYFK